MLSTRSRKDIAQSIGPSCQSEIENECRGKVPFKIDPTEGELLILDTAKPAEIVEIIVDRIEPKRLKLLGIRLPEGFELRNRQRFIDGHLSPLLLRSMIE